MNQTNIARNRRPSGKQPLTIAGVAGAILLLGYVIAQPRLNERFGWELPALGMANTTQPADETRSDERSQTDRRSSRSADNQSLPANRAPGATAESPPASEKNAAADKPSAATQPPSPGASAPAVAVDSDRVPPEDPNLKFGLLRDVGNERYLSPMGLQYTRGSQEGHRLEHLKRHTVDQPSRPGSHGVFEGGMEAVVRVLDEAYTKVKEEPSGVTKKQDQDRTVYTVNMGRRIGYVGGRDGNRRRKPMARRVRIVLEGTRVITAYPL